MRRSLFVLVLSLLPGLAAAAEARAPGSVFRDCADCPEMVVVPAGRFAMGSPAALTEREGITEKRGKRERPVHEVTIAKPFAIGRFEVTRAEYAAFAAASGRTGGEGCRHWTGTGFAVDATKSWRDPGYPQTDRDPATCLSWEDATAYAAWLAAHTGQPYRLPSEAEWEYAARAGSDAARFWGDDAAAACAYGNVYDDAAARTGEFPDMTPHGCDDGHAKSAPVGSFRPNRFGLHDTAGNVWEWTADCWHVTYGGAPADGGARTAGGDCGQRVLRGGAWISIARYLRSANRSKMAIGARIYRNGLRLARDLAP